MLAGKLNKLRSEGYLTKEMESQSIISPPTTRLHLHIHPHQLICLLLHIPPLLLVCPLLHIRPQLLIHTLLQTWDSPDYPSPRHPLQKSMHSDAGSEIRRMSAPWPHWWTFAGTYSSHPPGQTSSLLMSAVVQEMSQCGRQDSHPDSRQDSQEQVHDNMSQIVCVEIRRKEPMPFVNSTLVCEEWEKVEYTELISNGGRREKFYTAGYTRGGRPYGTSSCTERRRSDSTGK